MLEALKQLSFCRYTQPTTHTVFRIRTSAVHPLKIQVARSIHQLRTTSRKLAISAASAGSTHAAALSTQSQHNLASTKQEPDTLNQASRDERPSNSRAAPSPDSAPRRTQNDSAAHSAPCAGSCGTIAATTGPAAVGCSCGMQPASSEQGPFVKRERNSSN